VPAGFHFQLSKLQFLDEADEENLLVLDAYGDMYQPLSLVLISKLPLFELLQVRREKRRRGEGNCVPYCLAPASFVE